MYFQITLFPYIRDVMTRPKYENHLWLIYFNTYGVISLPDANYVIIEINT